MPSVPRPTHTPFSSILATRGTPTALFWLLSGFVTTLVCVRASVSISSSLRNTPCPTIVFSPSTPSFSRRGTQRIPCTRSLSSSSYAPSATCTWKPAFTPGCSLRNCSTRATDSFSVSSLHVNGACRPNVAPSSGFFSAAQRSMKRMFSSMPAFAPSGPLRSVTS